MSRLFFLPHKVRNLRLRWERRRKGGLWIKLKCMGFFSVRLHLAVHWHSLTYRNEVAASRIQPAIWRLEVDRTRLQRALHFCCCMSMHASRQGRILQLGRLGRLDLYWRDRLQEHNLLRHKLTVQVLTSCIFFLSFVKNCVLPICPVLTVSRTVANFISRCSH